MRSEKATSTTVSEDFIPATITFQFNKIKGPSKRHVKKIGIEDRKGGGMGGGGMLTHQNS